MIVRKLKTNELHLLTQLYNYNDVDDMIAKNTEDMEKGVIDIFCAFKNNILLGELHVNYENEDVIFAERDKRAYLFAFRVHKDHQGQGVGTQLLETVIEKLTELGYTEFTVGVESDNVRARRMYEKYGFLIPIARRKESYQGDAYEYDLLLKRNFVSQ